LTGDYGDAIMAVSGLMLPEAERKGQEHNNELEKERMVSARLSV
jgi:hypothetical protein